MVQEALVLGAPILSLSSTSKAKGENDRGSGGEGIPKALR
jgi:hypothetical protein